MEGHCFHHCACWANALIIGACWANAFIIGVCWTSAFIIARAGPVLEALGVLGRCFKNGACWAIGGPQEGTHAHAPCCVFAHLRCGGGTLLIANAGCIKRRIKRRTVLRIR